MMTNLPFFPTTPYASVLPIPNMNPVTPFGGVPFSRIGVPTNPGVFPFNTIPQGIPTPNGLVPFPQGIPTPNGIVPFTPGIPTPNAMCPVPYAQCIPQPLGWNTFPMTNTTAVNPFGFQGVPVGVPNVIPTQTQYCC